jgi:hypothetical protein
MTSATMTSMSGAFNYPDQSHLPDTIFAVYPSTPNQSLSGFGVFATIPAAPVQAGA